MLARVDTVTRVEVVRGPGRQHPDRPYRRAAVLHDARSTCARGRPDRATCGAIIEVYRNRQRARARAAALPSALADRVAQKGQYVLRVSHELDASQVAAYERAFTAAVRHRERLARTE